MYLSELLKELAGISEKNSEHSPRFHEFDIDIDGEVLVQVVADLHSGTIFLDGFVGFLPIEPDVEALTVLLSANRHSDAVDRAFLSIDSGTKEIILRQSIDACLVSVDRFCQAVDTFVAVLRTWRGKIDFGLAGDQRIAAYPA